MPITLPQVTIVGTLTADPVLRFTNAGKAFANVTIVSNQRTYNKETQQYEDGSPTFVRGTLWGNPAENLAESLSKGNRVIAAGVLKQNDWTDKEGNKRSTLQLDIDAIGPELKWATAKPVKTTGKSNSGGGGSETTPWSSGEPDW